MLVGVFKKNICENETFLNFGTAFGM